MKIWINAPFSKGNMELVKNAAKGCEVYTGSSPQPGTEIIVGQPGGADLTGVKLLTGRAPAPCS